MKERKYVKFRVDMFDDTKFKIIDLKPERDLIHYVWTRLVVLAGKVNLEGDLYLSKNIPYTIETLAVEFNRDVEQIKLAINVFIDLEMLEITKGNIYRVKNFAKHQNIKVKERNMYIEEKDKIKIKDEILKEDFYNESKPSDNKLSNNVTKKSNDYNIKSIENDNIRNVKAKNIPQSNIPIVLKSKKRTKGNKKRKNDTNINVSDIDSAENEIVSMYDGFDAMPLGENDRVVGEWSF
ncbi:MULTISPECIES: phage replisome organizer N-terminal domain-containing protein [unclassified Clostridium]|uniref:phage replisome organizer N-terminal domain-containing protein n=1 Tax=unclassified Clostridium TaxID=2614128 RepID=UPI0002985B9E|nr:MULTISPECIES: phage replisome organizer N-terminal domain-containing protein [unclassified Clostridium]EKQ54459.1 MAG: putative phage replisome organizer [Clostridium sp. Maddingley MBC34-26]